jgi:hypothetical protein
MAYNQPRGKTMNKFNKSFFLILTFTVLSALLAVTNATGYNFWPALFSSDTIFNDFYFDRREDDKTYLVSNEYTLPPIALAIGQFWSLFPTQYQVRIFLTSTIMLISYLSFLYTKNLKSVLLLMVLYPTYFALLRGNNDIYILALLLVLVNTKNLYKSAFILSIMVGIEPFTILFYFLKNNYNKLSYFTTFLAFSILVWLSPLLLSPHDIFEYLSLSSKSRESYFIAYELGNGGIFFGNSIWSLVKVYYFSNLKVPDSTSLEFLANLYLIISILIILLILKKIGRCNFLESGIVISACLVIFPFVSADYKLVYFIPFYLHYVFRCPKIFLDKRLEYFFQTLLILLFIPKNFFIFNIEGIFILSGSFLNPIVLIILTLFILSNSKKLNRRVVQKVE